MVPTILAGLPVSLPLALVHVLSHILLYSVATGTRVEPLVSVIISVDTGVVGGELPHLIEAVLDGGRRPRVAPICHLPEKYGVAVLLKNRRSSASTRGSSHRPALPRSTAPSGSQTSGQEGGPAGRAACLAVPVGEDGALCGDLIDVRVDGPGQRRH
jgi:hypothetical protein